jgi:hypothetical protein
LRQHHWRERRDASDLQQSHSTHGRSPHW